MSNLSDFVGGSSGSRCHIGYYTNSGVIEQVDKRSGVAFLEYANSDVQYSLDGVSVDGVLNSENPYVPYTNGIWVISDVSEENPQVHVIITLEAR